MSNHKTQSNTDKFKDELKSDLAHKGVIFPIVCIILTIIACVVLSNPDLNIFPNSDNIDGSDFVIEYEDSSYLTKGE